MAEYGKKIIKMVDYEAMRAAFDEKFKETMQLIESGETHLDNLAEGFHEADGVIFRMPAADVAPVVHGRWVINRKSEDAYTHHMCSKCKTDAPFHYTYVDDYDEGLDGEWYYLRQRVNGIVEYMGDYCPNCGAKMDGDC